MNYHCTKCGLEGHRRRYCKNEPSDKKYCSGCKELKFRSDFGKCVGKKSGLADHCKPCRKFIAHKKHGQIKAEVIDAYGSKCECCGESELGFLTLDHKNNDGKKQRASITLHASNFYIWLMKNDFPDNLGLRVLCANCNIGRQHNGGTCPHILPYLVNREVNIFTDGRIESE